VAFSIASNAQNPLAHQLTLQAIMFINSITLPSLCEQSEKVKKKK
jgi:hypothetical protein